MKRPGPVGMTIVLTFALVAAIELRTLLGMLGVEVQTQLYYAVTATVILGSLVVLYALPDGGEGNLSKA